MIRFDTIPHETTAREVCGLLRIPFDRQAHRRIARAFYLIQQNAITPEGENGMDRLYRVQSQTDADQSYTVRVNGLPYGSCQCPDWRKHDLNDAEAGVPFTRHHCKHLIAARLSGTEVLL